MLKKIKDFFPISSGAKRDMFLIFSFLLFLNVFAWGGIFFASKKYPILLGLAVVAYGFGLRHAVDADHIATIDNTTRKLMRDGKKPVGVGLFFSLGHSTVVILLSVLVAFSAKFVSENLPAFKVTGAIIGTSISCLFLLAIGIINLIAFLEIFSTWRTVVKHTGEELDTHFVVQIENPGGILTKILAPVLRAVDASYKMYFVGFLFGLGFDTASEIGLLSISALGASSNIPVAYVLLIPFVFMAGMTLVDTLDGILMLRAYGWAYVMPIRKLYYNMNITLVSVITALFIGGVEGVQLISQKLALNSSVFAIINRISLDNMGFFIILIFAFCWIVSIAMYKFQGYENLDFTVSPNGRA